MTTTNALLTQAEYNHIGDRCLARAGFPVGRPDPLRRTDNRETPDGYWTGPDPLQHPGTSAIRWGYRLADKTQRALANNLLDSPSGQFLQQRGARINTVGMSDILYAVVPNAALVAWEQWLDAEQTEAVQHAPAPGDAPDDAPGWDWTPDASAPASAPVAPVRMQNLPTYEQLSSLVDTKAMRQQRIAEAALAQVGDRAYRRRTTAQGREDDLVAALEKIVDG